MVFPGGSGGGHGFLEHVRDRDAPGGSGGAPPSTLSGSHREKSQVGGWRAPLTSPGLAHQGHNLARGQREGEVSEHLEAGTAGVTGRNQETLSQTGFLAPCCPGPSQSLPAPPRGAYLEGDIDPQVPRQAPSPALNPQRNTPAPSTDANLKQTL